MAAAPVQEDITTIKGKSSKSNIVIYMGSVQEAAEVSQVDEASST
jgi:hypothetical protein|tara:strand:+ start:138 stop:272 length:135 start_codon:yes stop_codon:yes gene_type:complete